MSERKSKQIEKNKLTKQNKQNSQNKQSKYSKHTIKNEENHFNVNDVGVANGRYFGMPYESSEADVVLISVPWDATVSYSAGTALGPAAIIGASVQIDLFDEQIENSEKIKIGTDETLLTHGNSSILAEDYILYLNEESRQKAEKIIDSLSQGNPLSARLKKYQEEINKCSEGVNYIVKTICSNYYKIGKIPGVVGGEHSVAFGAIEAAAESLKKGEKLSVLQIDAHADLRKAYEGFEYSHASVMYNVINKVKKVESLTQVAIRDFCLDEYDYIKSHNNIHSFTSKMIHSDLYKGKNWNDICREISSCLGDNVYISFDIDGLDASLCPNTGTPVPGGLEYEQAIYLLETIAKEHRIVGFDLNEVAPSKDGKDEWDANVGGRLLYKLSLLAASHILK